MFVPHSEIDLKKMFEELSISSLEELFTHIPETLKLNDGLNVPPSLSELESISEFENLESKNTQNLIEIISYYYFATLKIITINQKKIRDCLFVTYNQNSSIDYKLILFVKS